MKLAGRAERNPAVNVAPRAGAWIETSVILSVGPIASSHPVRVRGLKQALRALQPVLLLSHPVRVRGLKHQVPRMRPIKLLSHPVRVRGLKPMPQPLAQLLDVAPRAGAWIETFCKSACYSYSRSHPVRVRGLKPPVRANSAVRASSHPVRVRGLKQSANARGDFSRRSHPGGCVD